MPEDSNESAQKYLARTNRGPALADSCEPSCHKKYQTKCTKSKETNNNNNTIHQSKEKMKLLSSLTPVPPQDGAGANKDSMCFESLTLVEKPDSPLNSSYVPLTLEDCVGYMTKLPLRSPNADSKKPSTIAE